MTESWEMTVGKMCCQQVYASRFSKNPFYLGVPMNCTNGWSSCLLIYI
jgi:hypothetical protein